MNVLQATDSAHEGLLSKSGGTQYYCKPKETSTTALRKPIPFNDQQRSQFEGDVSEANYTCVSLCSECITCIPEDKSYVREVL